MIKHLRAGSWLLLAGALLAGCHKNDDSGPAAPNLNVALTPVATSASVLWTGVAKNGRVFATFPRMDTDTIPYSLAVVNGTTATPFPNADRNTWDPSVPPQNHFVNAQSLHLDANNFQSSKLPSMDVDGLALTPAGDYLYYHATTARTLYRIGTQYL